MVKTHTDKVLSIAQADTVHIKQLFLIIRFLLCTFKVEKGK